MAKSMERPTASESVIDSNMFSSQPKSTRLPTVTTEAEPIVNAAEKITAKSQVVNNSIATDRPTERSSEDTTPETGKGKRRAILRRNV